MVSHIIYLTTFLIRKDGDFIFRFLIHVDIWQNQYNIVKLKKKKLQKKKYEKKRKENDRNTQKVKSFIEM